MAVSVTAALFCLIKSYCGLETASTWLLPHISWQGGYMLLPADQGLFPAVKCCVSRAILLSLALLSGACCTGDPLQLLRDNVDAVPVPCSMPDCVQILEAEGISRFSTHEAAHALQVGPAAVAWAGCITSISRLGMHARVTCFTTSPDADINITHGTMPQHGLPDRP